LIREQKSILPLSACSGLYAFIIKTSYFNQFKTRICVFLAAIFYSLYRTNSRGDSFFICFFSFNDANETPSDFNFMILNKYFVFSHGWVSD